MKSRKEKSELGQFLTPKSTADFMAKLLCFDGYSEIKLLDAGAGTGILTDSVLDTLHVFKGKIKLTHYDIDESLVELLKAKYKDNDVIDYELFTDDFIENSIMHINSGETPFTHAIQNPPYKKINSNSKDRKNLRNVGVETVNLYSGFVSLTLLMLQDKGEMVAIIPRSFCNGPYYKSFRELIYKLASIDHIHLFDSRSKPFKEEKVLQESVIIKFTKGKEQGNVIVSHSTDASFDDVEYKKHAFSEIVKFDDQEMFIHIPSDLYEQTLDDYKSSLLPSSQLGINVSTGPVVGFRVIDELCQMPELDTVPLIYPGHFKNYKFMWPIKNFKKPNAIKCSEVTKKWLYESTGTYVVVNRFSTKDEKKRVVANIIECGQFNTELIGFENHLNVYHMGKKGLPQKFAYGLVAFLNSTLVDNSVRIFNGHTQINATDLKNMKYPHCDVLERLGEFMMNNPNISDEELDRKVVAEIEQNGKTYKRGA